MELIKYPSSVDLNLFKSENSNLAPKYGLPEDVTFCKNRVISNQRPNSAVEYKHTKDGPLRSV